jgi:undecaprenyl-diphosphatase
MGLTLTAILLGIVEGLTEFVPVSSTGHLILASELFGYDAAQWAMFNVVIQLGAILAVVVLYWRTFWNAGMGVLRLESEGLRFARNIVIAVLPSAVLGKIFKDQIDVMLGTPAIVGWA